MKLSNVSKANSLRRDLKQARDGLKILQIAGSKVSIRVCAEIGDCEDNDAIGYDYGDVKVDSFLSHEEVESLFNGRIFAILAELTVLGVEIDVEETV